MTMARQTKFTKARAKAILELLSSARCRFRSACLVAGVSPTTGHEWLQRGEGVHPKRKPTKELVAFAEEVRTAEARGEAVAMARVQQHMNGGAKATETRRKFKGVMRVIDGVVQLDDKGKPIVDRVLIEENVIEHVAAPDLKAAIFVLTSSHGYSTRHTIDVNADVQHSIAQLPDEVDSDDIWDREIQEHFAKMTPVGMGGGNGGGNGHDPSVGSNGHG